MKREREDWSRLYYKTLKELETMIDVQRMAKDIKRLVKETNTILTEIEGMVLTTSINNQIMNATNITQISEDLQYLVQSDMDKQAFQVQRMLANELDHYKEKGNFYMNSNIKIAEGRLNFYSIFFFIFDLFSIFRTRVRVK